MNRRKAIQQTLIGAGGLAVLPSLSCNAQNDPKMEKEKVLAGKVNHSVARWCYNKMPLEALCEGAQDIGIKSIEIVGEKDWPILQKYGLTCALGTHAEASIPDGFNDKKNHDKLIPIYIDLIDKAADAGVPNVIVFSGNRREISDEEGMENCAIGLDKIAKHAEKKDVMVVMELLNSKVNHKDYQCDNSNWGVGLVDKIGSSHFKLLYDIYHMQIMEGDIIATIRKNKDYYAHYHTGGVPGRNEINANQELNYVAIMKAIVETGYTGWVAQEFIPTYDDQLAALREGVEICDV